MGSGSSPHKEVLISPHKEIWTIRTHLTVQDQPQQISLNSISLSLISRPHSSNSHLNRNTDEKKKNEEEEGKGGNCTVSPSKTSSSSSGSGASHQGIRLSNTTLSEVAPCLPLPSLPVFCGASDQDLRLFDEPSRRLNYYDAAQAARIADLLRATDVSYL